ncbi:MAG: co-chaperone GroES [Candidatus Aenigmarchaeota archaeon ex4484_52]|nr:MAG: co-chaperone GroES [Candidatus Aenigmarchaeota archaeon ex4484_52]
MNIIPLENKVLVRKQKEEEKTKGGIYIPDSAKEKTQIGVIEEIGKTKETILKKGDVVFYKKYSGEELKIDGNEYLILGVSDILAKQE